MNFHTFWVILYYLNESCFPDCCKVLFLVPGALICYMMFLSLEVVLQHSKSIIQLCIEYCFFVWIGDPNCFLDILDKVQKLEKCPQTSTRSLVVSDLRSETKGSRFESGSWLCAQVSSLQ